MENKKIIWLQNWYDSHCDQDWEHTYGIEIKTLDNPGWVVIIDIAETELEDYEFTEVTIERSDQDWINCVLKNNKFQGVGGSLNLLEILDIFREWVESKKYNTEKIEEDE